MAEPETVSLAPDGELARAIKAAAASGGCLVADTGDARFFLRVDRVDRGAPDPEQIARSIAGIRAAAGGWKHMDAEAFKAYIAERRKTRNRPPVHW